jgi:MFS family permease
MMVYFAYGALGLTAIASSFWVKNTLTQLSATDLAALAVWTGLPWSMKMVFGELVDSVPIMGSQRRVYIFIGAGLIALSLILFAGAASGFVTFWPPHKLYVAAAILTAVGVVVQDVVADAMTTEVVARTNADGSARTQREIDHDLAMVQVLGRLSLAVGMFVVSGIGGILAAIMAPAKVFLIGLVVPAISIAGALLVKTDTTETRAIDWRILGGGLAFGAFVMLLGVTDVPFGQEITFIVSLAVIGIMLSRVTGEMSAEVKTTIFFAAMLIFLFRVSPNMGPGFQWYEIDKLGFDETFFGWLGQINTLVALVAGWLIADALTRMRIVQVMLWLTILGTALMLPSLFLIYGGHVWTERVFGIGARSIAVIDTAVSSPLAMISMIPLLTLVAKYAPRNSRATWFALMSSFMNLALMAGELMTKYLTQIFVVTRGEYSQLGRLALAVTVLGFVVPFGAIVALRRKVE